MAMPTATHAPPPAQQAATPGVGASPGVVGPMHPPGGAVAQTPTTMPAKPVLFDDLDGVLLLRLYPDAKTSEDARAGAKKAGAAAYEDSAKIVAAAQVDTQEIPPEGAAPQGPSTKDTIRQLSAAVVSNAANQALRERGDPRAPAEEAPPAHA